MPAIIYGAMEGAGQAGVATGLQMQRQLGEQDLLKMRAEAEQELARTTASLARETHAITSAQDIANIPKRQAAELPGQVAAAKAIPQKLAAGESIVEGGKVTVTAPTPKETSGFYEAYADLMKARAEEIRAGAKGKQNLPNVSAKTNEDGTQHFLLDSNSGAVGRIIPGQPAKEAISHWFKADEPAKAAVPQVVEWTHNGKVLPGGLDDLYPVMSKRSGAQAGGAASAAGGMPAAANTPSAAAVTYLQQHPESATDFDAKYGKGASAQFAKPTAKAAPAPAQKGVVNAEVARTSTSASREAAVERGRQATATFSGTSAFVAPGKATTLDDVRAILAKKNPNVNELMLLEGHKDSAGLTPAERAKIAELIKSLQ